MDRPSAFEPARANLRAAEILKHRHFTARSAGSSANAGTRRFLRFVSAMRKIETEDVRAGGDQRIEHIVGIAGRTDGRDDLGVTHASGFEVQRSVFSVHVLGSGSEFSVLSSQFSVLE